ncbi:hypothetical protein, conserved [Eimeria necatrix]|uniref:Transmembrane protein n=1 Tax=Eimeria necatrix TaxID=51315 RepID=U6N355_9EIME|nr:hypothetical protein, conserved [Eimeria necatrix]CDJ69164.1 hypothetical protein, conserved [Eimeria necatrix]
MVRSFASFVFFASLAAVTAAASGPTPALGSFGYEAQTASQVSVDVPLGQQKHEAILRRRSRGARVLLATSALAATLAMAFLIMHCFMLLKNSQHRGSRLRRLSSDDEGACEVSRGDSGMNKVRRQVAQRMRIDSNDRSSLGLTLCCRLRTRRFRLPQVDTDWPVVASPAAELANGDRRGDEASDIEGRGEMLVR